MKIRLSTTTKRQNTSHQTHITKHHKFTLSPNPPSLQNKTTDVVIHQHSRKLLMMDILISETCWVHKKWNKIVSDIKLVFYSSSITMMHGPINIIFSIVSIPRYSGCACPKHVISALRPSLFIAHKSLTSTFLAGMQTYEDTFRNIANKANLLHNVS